MHLSIETPNPGEVWGIDGGYKGFCNLFVSEGEGDLLFFVASVLLWGGGLVRFWHSWTSEDWGKWVVSMWFLMFLALIFNGYFNDFRLVKVERQFHVWYSNSLSIELTWFVPGVREFFHFTWGLERKQGSCIWGIITFFFYSKASAPYFPGVGVSIDRCITGNSTFMNIYHKLVY